MKKLLYILFLTLFVASQSFAGSISIKAFEGENPRLADNLLDVTQAKTAENCKLERGDLRSFRDTSETEVLSGSDFESLFEYDGDYITDADDLDYAISPIAQDAYARTYFSGETEVRAYANDLVYPAYYKVGVPAPTLKPEVAVNTGGSSNEEERIYAYCRVTAYGEEGPPCPITDLPGSAFLADDTVDITKIEAIPADREIETLRVYRTVAGSEDTAEFVFVKDYTLPTIEGDWATGVSSGDDGEYWQFDDGSDDIIYKCVHDSTSCDPDDATNGVGGSGTDYWEYYTLLDNIDTADLDTGSVCPSSDWGPPVAGLTHLQVLPSGRMMGFKGNELYFSEPFLPHAWGSDTISFEHDIVGISFFGSTVVVLTEGYHSVGYGDDPETMTFIQLNDFCPCAAKKSIARVQNAVIFASKRDGLKIIDQDGIRTLTSNILTRDDWIDILPTYIQGFVYASKYFAFNSSSSGTSFVLDLELSTYSTLKDTVYAGYVSIADGKFYVIANELEDPEDPTSSYVYKIKEWEGETYNFKRYIWKSKKFQLNSLVNFSCARVTRDEYWYDDLISGMADSAYLATLNADMISNHTLYGCIGCAAINELAINDDYLYDLESTTLNDTVTFYLYVNGNSTPKVTRTVTSSDPFKLPAGYKGRVYEIGISGYVPIRQVDLATSMRELGQ